MSTTPSATLDSRHCVPCAGGVPPMPQEAIEKLLPQIPGWQAVDAHHLERTFKFSDFKEALDFVNRIGAVAEAEGHHPDIELSWGMVGVHIFTHKIDGLTESDFILAAKISAL